jgi:carboxyl-terminal processing protease
MLRGLKLGLIIVLLVASLALSFGLGYGLGQEVHPSGPAFASVEQTWNIILNDYVEKDKIDVDALSQAAIEGMVEALDDPYTAYLDAETYQFELGGLEGKFEGIGAEVTMRDGQLIVIAPLASSPAAEAGIQPGDAILKIDDISTSDMSLYEAILKVRGPKGTSVSLLILHQGETEPVEIVIVRDVIDVDSVNFEMRGDIAYINITGFTGQTNEELSLVLEAIDTENASGIILDLRGNPGGGVKAVVNVASRFLDEDEVVFSIRDNEGNLDIIKANSQEVTTDLPMVVLVDGFSASGSEVLAGAFQDNGRATIAGTTTFGKGSVNYLIQLEDGSGLYITYARWLTPNGSLIEGKGIVPDIELEITGEDAIQWAIDYLHGNI